MGSSNSKCYRVYNPVIRRIMESRNVIFIETPSRLLPPPSEVSHTQLLPSSNATKVYNYTSDDDFCGTFAITLRCWNPLPVLLWTRITSGGLPTNPPVAELLDRISDITRRDILAGGAAGLPLEGVKFGGPSAENVLEGGIILDGTSPEGVSQEGVLEHLEQPISPGAASLESSYAASSPLQHRGHSHLEETPAVTRAGVLQQDPS